MWAECRQYSIENNAEGRYYRNVPQNRMLGTKIIATKGNKASFLPRRRSACGSINVTPCVPDHDCSNCHSHSCKMEIEIYVYGEDDVKTTHALDGSLSRKVVAHVLEFKGGHYRWTLGIIVERAGKPSRLTRLGSARIYRPLDDGSWPSWNFLYDSRGKYSFIIGRLARGGSGRKFAARWLAYSWAKRLAVEWLLAGDNWPVV